MNAYRIALFLHLIALMLATGATAVTKLAVGRRIRARTVGEALEWHDVLIGASKLFPVALAIFVITGSYMLGVAGAQVWTTGFVVAGLVGVASLFASGTFLGSKAKSLRNVLANIAKEGGDRPAPRLAPPLLVAILPVVNTGIALSVVFDMVTKPTSVPVALGVMVIGVMTSLVLALRTRRAAAFANAKHAAGSDEQPNDRSRAA